MAISELLPAVRALPRPEKFQLLQFLVVELGQAEGVDLFDVDTTYPLWTPYDVPSETVSKLESLLAEEQEREP